MNAQHSSQTQRWFTPISIIDTCREVLGEIDLDPASEETANQYVKATRFFTKEQDGLSQSWAGSVFVNPPGGKVRNQSLSGMFWKKLMDERLNIEHAIFLAFSIETLQTCQSFDCPPMMAFPLCVPSKRLKYWSPENPGQSPTHASVLVYVPGTTDASDVFLHAFSRIGSVTPPIRNTQKDPGS